MVADLILIALGIALQPFRLSAFILILSTEGGPKKGLGFILGWLASLVLVVAVVVLITGGKPVSLAAGQRREHVGKDGVGPGVQLVAGQQLNRMRDIDHAGARHAEPAGLLDGFVRERCRRDADRRDAPALQVN